MPYNCDGNSVALHASPQPRKSQPKKPSGAVRVGIIKHYSHYFYLDSRLGYRKNRRLSIPRSTKLDHNIPISGLNEQLRAWRHMKSIPFVIFLFTLATLPIFLVSEHSGHPCSARVKPRRAGGLRVFRETTNAERMPRGKATTDSEFPANCAGNSCQSPVCGVFPAPLPQNR